MAAGPRSAVFFLSLCRAWMALLMDSGTFKTVDISRCEARGVMCGLHFKMGTKSRRGGHSGNECHVMLEVESSEKVKLLPPF